MANPLIDQGSLNRIRGSITIPNFPALNITAPYLGKQGIRLALQGESVVYLPTMTGAVTSQEPYMMIEVAATLLKTQPLSNQFKLQMESSALIGDISVRPDAAQLGIYEVVNSSIKGVREMSFAGDEPGWVVTLGGYYLVNNSLFD